MLSKIYSLQKFFYIESFRENLIKSIKIMEKNQTQPKELLLPEKMSKFQMLRHQVDPLLREKWQREQQLIRKFIVEKNDFTWNLNTLNLVAGVDLSASKDHPDYACVALIIYSIQTRTVVYEDCRLIQINQPYIPGFLAFREVPSLYVMLLKLKNQKPQFYPQLILLDGNGILHSNFCGLASHLGVLLDTPTIGAGKTLFYIDGLTKDKVKQLCDNDIKKGGDFALLKGDSGKIWGAALRSTENSKNPIFISIGTKIQLQTAIQVVKKLSLFRVVEPIRLADKKSREIIDKIDFKNLQKYKIQKFDMVYFENLHKKL